MKTKALQCALSTVHISNSEINPRMVKSFAEVLEKAKKDGISVPQSHRDTRVAAECCAFVLQNYASLLNSSPSTSQIQEVVEDASTKLSALPHASKKGCRHIYGVQNGLLAKCIEYIIQNGQ